MTSPRELEAIEAELAYWRDSVALQRARLYRRGESTSPRLIELERHFDSAQARLRAARTGSEPVSSA